MDRSKFTRNIPLEHIKCFCTYKFSTITILHSDVNAICIRFFVCVRVLLIILEENMVSFLLLQLFSVVFCLFVRKQYFVFFFWSVSTRNKIQEKQFNVMAIVAKCHLYLYTYIVFEKRKKMEYNTT